MKITIKALSRFSLSAIALTASLSLTGTSLLAVAKPPSGRQQHKPAHAAQHQQAAAKEAQAPTPAEEVPQPQSNKDMAERLDQIGQVLDAVMLNFYPDQRLGKYIFQITQPPDTRSKI